MTKRENQRIALTKRLLQEGLLRLLETKDLEKITVTELCRESGINRATFYNHYGSAHDLLYDLEAQIAADIRQLIGEPTTTEEIIRHTEAVCSYLQENARSILVLARCHADDDMVDAIHMLHQNVPHRHLLNLQNKMDADSIHLINTYLYTGYYHLIREWLVKGIQKTPKEITQLLMTIVSSDVL